ncbi:BTB and MATH domain-containing protein 43-like isoform X3 [Leptopilina heterotoma]|uniref:BTB and MATH domain-containing protein 43-like isoform X3 n=1 Tax=Leptopilina heterotoma TaxID=63436 RepID=UPI001CA9D285|nr:BTB and MATH domain-containing protein 43-like isoform X3 [Leptopilina heterotoma]
MAIVSDFSPIIKDIVKKASLDSDDESVHWLQITIPYKNFESGICKGSINEIWCSCSLEFYKIDNNFRAFIKFLPCLAQEKYKVTFYRVYNHYVVNGKETQINNSMFNSFICFGEFTITNLRKQEDILLLCKIEAINVADLDVVISKNITSAKFFSLYQQRKFTDFKIICEDQEFWVHKIILICQSDVFRVMLENPMTEARDNKLIIGDFELKIVEEMIRYLYTDEITGKLSQDELKQLLLIANKYNLENLKKLSLKKICKLIKDFKEAYELLLCIESYNFDDLRQLMIKFMSDNAHLLSKK